MNLESLNAQLTDSQDLIDNADVAQYLTFLMDGEEYGIDILKVQEIRGWQSTTPIPNSPSYVKGVINLRGTIVPLLDLRQKFNLPKVDYSAVTVVIVLAIEQDGVDKIIGIVVDAVSDVYGVERSHIKYSPSLDENLNRQYIVGLAEVNAKTLIILNLNQLL
ncbi:chemotaxis protein CheW [Catenovulum adriaticum]|uniref:Chemotaxis protein CheW n=1 Tax=Catenovulum adriaticum TaxID=2984846 RepID=A0ABY7AKD3_9ALTE|nr:chemotaxis protein CheW [Catenovulum sp. TS8]WAJ69939.1 chemotaxis protein CheW [Catenovulum sp. TS8]